MRIVSFATSATQIVTDLGLNRSLTGVSTFCDAEGIPIVTRPRSAACHGNSPVKLLECDLYLLEPDIEKLTKASPDIVLVQNSPKGNATAYEDVVNALKKLPKNPKVFSFNPMTLQEVFDTLQELSKVLNAQSKGEKLIGEMGRKLQNLKKLFLKQETKPKTAIFLDRVEPLMLGNYWIPELLSDVPGLEFPLNQAGKPSAYVAWNDILELNPDYLFIAPELHSLQEAGDVVQKLNRTADFHSLKAFNKKQVFLFDGKKYFNAPVPTLIDSLEAVGQALYPETFGTNLIGKVWAIFY